MSAPEPPAHVKSPNHWRAANSMGAECPECGVWRKTRKAWDDKAGLYRHTGMGCGHVWLYRNGAGRPGWRA